MSAITIEQARKVLETVDAGLTQGVGDPRPGKMCVEAAVCYGLGEEHSDRPSCVAPAVRNFKIQLNDRANWDDDMDRAVGLRRIAVAQLGSVGILDEEKFGADVARLAGISLASCCMYCESEGRFEAGCLGRAIARLEPEARRKGIEAAIEALRLQNCPGVKLMDELGI